MFSWIAEKAATVAAGVVMVSNPVTEVIVVATTVVVAAKTLKEAIED